MGSSAQPVALLLSALSIRAAVLAEVCAAAPPGARGLGADASGVAAVGCDEMLIHSADIAAGLGVAFTPSRDLCARVLARLFPWAPAGEHPWQALLWANGRAALGTRPRLGPDWRLHLPPLDEWDGADPTRGDDRRRAAMRLQRRFVPSVEGRWRQRATREERKGES